MKNKQALEKLEKWAEKLSFPEYNSDIETFGKILRDFIVANINEWIGVGTLEYSSCDEGYLLELKLAYTFPDYHHVNLNWCEVINPRRNILEQIKKISERVNKRVEEKLKNNEIN